LKNDPVNGMIDETVRSAEHKGGELTSQTQMQVEDMAQQVKSKVETTWGNALDVVDTPMSERHFSPGNMFSWRGTQRRTSERIKTVPRLFPRQPLICYEMQLQAFKLLSRLVL